MTETEVAADQSASADQEPWQISADRIRYDEKAQTYHASGDVSITRRGRTLTADRISFDQGTRRAVAAGNVTLLSGPDRLEGSRLTFNLDTETGVLTDGSLFIEENHLYLRGAEIMKTGQNSYKVRDGSLTSCDAPTPDWKITSSDIEVTLEGYGRAKHAALWAKKLPLVYIPYLVFPAKSKRQSGLLMPEFGYSSRKGDIHHQPFYWAINDSSDATFYAHYMSRRGIKGGVEYRYALSDQSLGTIMADGFTDRRVDDGSDDSSDQWGYQEDAGKDVLRPNSDRYWLRAKIDQSLPKKIMLKLDLDVVSDQDYLHEFRNSLHGFDATRNQFKTVYGRDIDDYNDPIRLNRLNLNRMWQRYSLNADLRWYDNVIKRRQREVNDTLQQLPAVSLDASRQPLLGSDLYVDADADYVYFYREKGTRGHRSDLHPRVYYPFYVLGGVSVEPSLGLRHTGWYLEHDEADPDRDGETFSRSLYDAKIRTDTEFYRVFAMDTAGYRRLKHVMRPELTYSYIPEVDQSRYPSFDAVDRIKAQNLATVALTNVLTAKKGDKPAIYNTFLRFKLSQGFDIDKHNDPEDDRPYTELKGELDLTPGRYVRLDGDTQWSHYDSHFTSGNATVHLWDGWGDRLDLTYRYTRENEEENIEAVDSLRADAEIKLHDRLRLRGGYEYNYQDNEELEVRVGASYQSQCWGVDLDYLIEEENRSVMVMVHLKGLGSFGN